MAIRVEKMIPVINDRIEKYTYSATELLSEYENNKKTGCLIGQVQSGKTQAIIDIVKTAKEKFNYHFIFILCGTTNMLLQQTKDRLEKNKIMPKDLENINDYTNVPTVCCVLKNVGILKKMIEKIEIFNESKILIIDDESDYASINTATSNETASAIFKCIKQSVDLIQKGGILFVSATPFSNIKKSNYDIKLDFIYANKYDPNNYTGIEFFSKMPISSKIGTFYIPEDRLDCIHFPISRKHGYNFDTLKIYKVICLWLISSYLLFKETDKKISDLLIYLSDKIEDNQDIKRIVKEYKPDKHQLSMIIEHFELEINMDDFIQFLNKYYDNRKVLLLVSDEKDNDVAEYNKRFEGLRIIIGGVYLSRGFTYEHLITEYFTYIGNDIYADTLLQRCRWFGYRKPYCQYMNVITTTKIHKALQVSKELVRQITEPNGCKFNTQKICGLINEWEEEHKQLLETTSNAKK